MIEQQYVGYRTGQNQQAPNFAAEQARFVNEQLSALSEQLNSLKQQVFAQEERIRQLEKHIHYPHNEAALKSSAAQTSAKVDTVPMRSDVEAILTMTAFIKRLLSPEDFAYAVTLEVRNEARRALGFKEREV